MLFNEIFVLEKESCLLLSQAEKDSHYLFTECNEMILLSGTICFQPIMKFL